MQNKRLVNALTKAGFKIETNSNNQSFVSGAKNAVSWYVQNEEAICVHVARHGDVSDSHIDYFAGFFVDSIKRAVHYAQEGA